MQDPIQEQLVHTRRTQILDAAAKVFADKGFHPATIKDIAKEAGIADGTIYIYFKNKPAVLLGILDRMTQTATNTLDPALLQQADLPTFLKIYFQQPLLALRADRFGLFRVVMSEIMVNVELRELYYQQALQPALALARPLFQKWVHDKSIRPIDIDLTLRAMSGIVFGLILANIAGDKMLDARWDALPDFLTDLMLNGLLHSADAA